MRALKWKSHADLAIRKTPSVGREEYLAYMTFQRNERPLFTEIFGPILGLKEEWEEQGTMPGELDFSAFPYRCEARAHLPVVTTYFKRRAGKRTRCLCQDANQSPGLSVFIPPVR